ncbi:MAG: DUF6796 family protein [Lachnospiraceae bacterium]
MELNLVYSILGLLGGITCAIGDILLDLKGKDNVKLGKSSMIESNWTKMANIRFKISIVLGFFGSFMCSLGLYSLSRQILGQDEVLAEVLLLVTIIMAMTGFFIHTFCCIAPITYKAVITGENFELADHTIETLFGAVKILFFILYLFIMLVPTAITIYCILSGLIHVPIWFVILNPFVFLIIGVLLRLAFPKYCYDLPGICMPSLGIGMFGLIGMINVIASNGF